jgi:hypothetical protein
MCTELLPPGGYPIAVKYILYKCRGIPRKDGARSALFLISELCYFMYFYVVLRIFVVLCIFVLFYVLFVL